MSGNPFEPQFNIIRLNKTGCGKIIRICFQPGTSPGRVFSKEGERRHMVKRQFHQIFPENTQLELMKHS